MNSKTGWVSDKNGWVSDKGTVIEQSTADIVSNGFGEGISQEGFDGI